MIPGDIRIEYVLMMIMSTQKDSSISKLPRLFMD